MCIFIGNLACCSQIQTIRRSYELVKFARVVLQHQICTKIGDKKQTSNTGTGHWSHLCFSHDAVSVPCICRKGPNHYAFHCSYYIMNHYCHFFRDGGRTLRHGKKKVSWLAYVVGIYRSNDYFNSVYYILSSLRL